MAIEIENITLLEYHEIPEDSELRREYDFAIKYGKTYNSPRDVFEVGDFTEQTFGFIKDIQQDYQGVLKWDTILEYIKKLTGKDFKEIAKYKLLAICRFNAYIISEINRINEIESNLLGHIATADEERAGIKNFSKFGAYPQLRKLAKEDLTKIEEVKNLPYSLCLLELHFSKIENEYKENLIKIQSEKNG